MRGLACGRPSAAACTQHVCTRLSSTWVAPGPRRLEGRIGGNVFSWCSRLSRQSNTLKVASSILAENTFFFGGGGGVFWGRDFFFRLFFFFWFLRCLLRLKRAADSLATLSRHVGAGAAKKSGPRARETQTATHIHLVATHMHMAAQHSGNQSGLPRESNEVLSVLILASPTRLLLRPEPKEQCSNKNKAPAQENGLWNEKKGKQKKNKKKQRRRGTKKRMVTMGLEPMTNGLLDQRSTN